MARKACKHRFEPDSIRFVRYRSAAMEDVFGAWALFAQCHACGRAQFVVIEVVRR